MDNANEELSKRLHEVLDVIGASECVRKKYWERAMLHEIPFTFGSQFYDETWNKNSYYEVGSSYEGTTTPGLHSDIDTIHCNENNYVVQNLVDAKQQGMSLLILTDEDTKPGYVRLQIVINKCLVSVGMCHVTEESPFKIDQKGRVCAKHVKGNDVPKTYRNGPADTFPASNGCCQSDLVYAYRCRQIPKSANCWLHRTRKYDWPSQKQHRTMGSYGCFLVGVGHPHSDNKSIEWRISFSLKERDLMSSLNETQHKCYILLKMIKKDIIESKAGESITSYHCKTSLFYTIENSQIHFWTEDKLILCARQCLVRLLIWVRAKHCPNYFIPEENMFDKLCPVTLKKIENVLQDIIDSGVNFLYSLTCDNVGELLISKERCSELAYIWGNTSIIFEEVSALYRRYRDDAASVYGRRNSLLASMDITFNSFTCYLSKTQHILVYLQNTNHITEHSTRDVRMALDSIIPHIQLQYQQSLFAQFLSRGDLSCLQCEHISNVISETSNCDLISSKLSLASLYIQSEQFEEECKSILVSCENSLERYVISVCQCNNPLRIYVEPAISEKLRFTDIPSKDFRRHYTTGCMVFHPSQVSLVHTSLHYELFRNVYTQSGSIFNGNNHYLLNWITVDSQIYLYFLQYLLYHKLKKRKEKESAVQKLTRALNTDYNLGHRETGLNLVGWICLQGKELHSAWRTFCLSWAIKPFKNAAKWHMLLLLREIIKGE